jgi:Flp pilus assembly protein TadD
MRETARRAAGGGEPAEKLERLQQYLFDEDSFPFVYDARATLTAAQAFAERRGNCVSFTNLFIALGRSLGVPLKGALIYLGESEVDDGLVVVNNHLVAVDRRPEKLVVYDFSSTRGRPPVGVEVIDDLWLTAIYLNNLGVEALRAGDLAAAAERLGAAIRLAPEFTAPYGNLGVARRLLGDRAGAFEAYSQALAVAPRSPAILANLARLYQDLGREDEAREALLAADLGGASAYLLVARGNLELARGRREEAMRLYKRARRTDPDLPEPWVAIARLELQRGRPAAARRALAMALGLDPDHAGARRLYRSLVGDL